MKNKSVQSCRFVHHAKFHCIMTTLHKLFKIELERGGLEKGQTNIFYEDFKKLDPFSFVVWGVSEHHIVVIVVVV